MGTNAAGERRARLRAAMGESLQGRTLLVTSLVNVRYLTGFSGSNAVLAISADDELLGTDGRYRDQVMQEAPDVATVIDRDTRTAVLDRLGTARLAVEPGCSAGDLLACRALDASTVVADALIERLRAVKDDGELASLERACAITATAFLALADELRVGMSEVQVARRLEQIFGELGADDRSFETIVGSGAAGALPHHSPSRQSLAEGDLVVIDAGALVDGYHADMTRTWIVGREPDPWQADLHAQVDAAAGAARQAVTPGADVVELDRVARERLEAAGLGENFTHGLGHGVGLEIHEAPMMGPRSAGSIGAGMAITVEPGAYLLGRGGVRIEDTLAVTASGSRVLTEAPRDLRVVGA